MSVITASFFKKNVRGKNCNISPDTNVNAKVSKWPLKCVAKTIIMWYKS